MLRERFLSKKHQKRKNVLHIKNVKTFPVEVLKMDVDPTIVSQEALEIGINVT